MPKRIVVKIFDDPDFKIILSEYQQMYKSKEVCCDIHGVSSLFRINYDIPLNCIDPWCCLLECLGIFASWTFLVLRAVVWIYKVVYYENVRKYIVRKCMKIVVFT